jgi:hypothetical protein
MKNSFIIGLLIICSLFSCNNVSDNKSSNIDTQIANSTSTEIIADFTKSYEGKINNKHEILMTLTNSKNVISGSYKYKAQANSLKLNGTIDNSGNINLNEFNDKGSITGIFKGKLTNSTISGTWEKPDGSKLFPFSASETNTQQSASTTSDWTGTYEDKFGATLTIKGPATDGAIKFKFEVVNEKCQSEYEGTAYLTKESVANFDDESGGKCHLNFTFNENQIEVQENDCDGYLGAACSFAGIYKKK